MRQTARASANRRRMTEKTTAAYMMKLVAAPAMKMEIVAFMKKDDITTSAIANMTPTTKPVVTKRLQTTSLWLDESMGTFYAPSRGER